MLEQRLADYISLKTMQDIKRDTSSWNPAPPGAPGGTIYSNIRVVLCSVCYSQVIDIAMGYLSFGAYQVYQSDTPCGRVEIILVVMGFMAYLHMRRKYCSGYEGE